MLKKTLNLCLLLIVSVIIFSVCYIIGVIKNWPDLTIIIYWILITFTTLVLKWITKNILSFFQKRNTDGYLNKYHKKNRVSVIYSYQRKNLKILNKNANGNVPWFLLTGYTENNGSLLNGVRKPIFHCTKKNNFTQPVRSLCWWFFHNFSILELSGRIYADPRLFSIVIRTLTSRISKKKPPSGMIIVIPLEQLLNPDSTSVQEMAQKYRSFTEQLSSKLQYNIPVNLIISGCDKLYGFSILENLLLKKDKKKLPGFFCSEDLFSECDVNQNSSLILHSLKKGISETIFRTIDDSLCDLEKNTLLKLPERMMDINESLKVFLSTFCVQNAYFSTARLYGVWLIGAEPGNNFQNNFPDSLVFNLLQKTHILNTQPERKLKKQIVFQSAIALTILSILGYSAYRISQLTPISSVTNSELLTQALLRNEKYFQSSPIYLPFSPVLRMKYLQLNEKLRLHTKYQSRSVSEIVEKYKDKYRVASPQNKRDMILSLATSLITWEKMRNNSQLYILSKEPKIPESLRLTRTENDLTYITALAVENTVIQESGGGRKLQELRELLTELINSDPTYEWLISDYSGIQDIKLSDFWVDADPAVVLSGIWTRQGKNMLYKWYTLITEAYGKRNVPEGLTSFIQHFHNSQQDNFRQFILAASNTRQHSYHRLMTSQELTDIVQNRTPEKKFFQFIEQELQDIPVTLAQDWLTDFRLFYRLHSLVRENNLIRQIKQSDLMLRTRLISLFNSSQLPETPGRLTAWWEWQDALHAAVNEEMNTSSSVNLIKETFFSENNLGKNSKLWLVFSKFEKLKSLFDTGQNDPVMDAIWDIYGKQVYLLLDNAIGRTSCWINEEWKHSVLHPLNTRPSNVSHEIMQDDTYQHIIDFLNGPAKGLMTLDPEGVRLISFKGRTIPFEPSFVHLINKVVTPDDLLDVQLQERTHDKDQLKDLQGQLTILNERLQKLESQPYKVTVNSAPATISGSSRIKPIGTYLKLDCKTGNSELRSMNFADSAVFTWYPGQCRNVNINIEFPAFSVSYIFSGDSAWDDFIKKFSFGESELLTEDFPAETKNVLNAINIKSILIRYKIDDATAVNQAYMEWSQLKKQIDGQDELQSELFGKLLAEKKQKHMGWLSNLPKNITTCPILQE
ncbi:type VI secretion protein IcmF/TssM N-terminal domain-containing protein [Escherichia sp. 20412-1]|uniref:type VI secretion protein IcmF/TssM N-terminal domain-containing protein n=1 Tax=Escherichia sp. 20412-1 TaxID=2137853 RepID=UPI000D158270|nr:type VI secretion protein IcmF/TssM N-terminal domain-containing protein [Escherichia sp. 20412-1]PSY62698.1 type VI secretion protein [Escherichia sp. 20412-1]